MARDTSFFDTIKQQVDLVDLATKHYSVELIGDGNGRMQACCPFHAEDTPSFKISESFDGNWKRWHCFGACDEGGTVIDFVMKAEGYEDAFEAAMYLNELYDLGLDVNDDAWKRFKKNRERNEAELAKDKAEMADADSTAAKTAREYLYARGFSDETIEQFGLVVNKDKRRLSIPLVDKANHLASIAYRSLFDSRPCRTCGEEVTAKEVRKRVFQARKARERNEPTDIDPSACPHCGAAGKEASIGWLAGQDPKYLFESDFEKAHYLYNQLPTRRALMKERDTVRGIYVVEGYADVWAGWQSDHHAIVAQNGAVLSDWQAKQIADMAVATDKPVILVPDTDATGRANVENNYRLLREANAAVVIQVVYGVDDLTYTEKGQEKTCKDLGDVLKHFGAEQVHTLMVDNRWPVEEWLIRYIIGLRNVTTGEPFHEKTRQMVLVREILGNVNDQIALDHIVPFLAESWRIRVEEARGWFYSNLAASDVVSAQHLIKDMWQAQAEALEFNADKDNVIPFGYEEIDRCLPGGGARKGWLTMWLGKSGTGKTMMSTALLGNMASSGTRSIIFSLEQKAGALWERMACQILDMDHEGVQELMESLWEKVGEELSADNPPDLRKLLDHNCPELAEVNKVHKNLYIVDNTPTGEQEAVSMTPGKISAIIREINMTKFEDGPCDVVFIDHLGILEVPEYAPRDVKGNDLAAPGFIMQELFKVCKATNTLMCVLQQLPKEVKPGVPVDYDAGRGGSKQTDFCDLIFGIYRPEMQIDLDDEERQSLAGEYKLRLGKNRHGPSATAHLYFDKVSLRIIPAANVKMPIVDGFVQGGDGVSSDNAVAITIGAATVNDPDATPQPIMIAVDDDSDPLPRDKEALLALLGAQPDDISDEPVQQLASDEALDAFIEIG